MGNHEYCLGCGASDFHNGESCKEAYPEKWAAKEKERRAKQDVIDKETTRVQKLVKATLRGGKKSVVARLLKIDDEQETLEKKQKKIEADLQALYNENKALSDHCPHPRKYVNDGFMYVSCNLCGQVDI